MTGARQAPWMRTSRFTCSKKPALHGCFLKVKRVALPGDSGEPADNTLMAPLASFVVDEITQTLDQVVKNGGEGSDVSERYRRRMEQ